MRAQTGRRVHLVTGQRKDFVSENRKKCHKKLFYFGLIVALLLLIEIKLNEVYLIAQVIFYL
jgi:hypothetical protein